MAVRGSRTSDHRHIWTVSCVRMGPFVFRQMITSHKLLAAVHALEPFLARVGSFVSLQLVASRKSLIAVLPVARERLIPSMSSQVSSQVRGFSIGFVANVADVKTSSSFSCSDSISLAIRAGTRTSFRRL